jgi:hypothetical protein
MDGIRNILVYDDGWLLLFSRCNIWRGLHGNNHVVIHNVSANVCLI